MFIWKKAKSGDFVLPDMWNCQPTQLFTGQVLPNPDFGLSYDKTGKKWALAIWWHSSQRFGDRTLHDTRDEAFNEFERFAKEFFRVVREIDGYGRVVE